MKKNKIKKTVFKKHYRKFNDKNSYDNSFPEYLPFDMEFVRENPAINIFTAVNERRINKEVTPRNKVKSILKNIK